MKAFTKESTGFFLAAFIIWYIMQIVIDMISGASFTEIFSVKQISIEVISAIIFAGLLTLFQIVRDNKKK